MLKNIIIFISILISAITYVNPDSLLLGLEIQLILYIALLIHNLHVTRSFNLLQTWILAFIYIIWSEAVLIVHNGDAVPYRDPIFFYFLSNNLVILSYYLSRPRAKRITLYQVSNNTSLFAVAMILCYITFVIYIKSDVSESIAQGRIIGETSKGTGDLFKTLMESIGLLLPSFIAYYFTYINKKSSIFQIILTVPLVLIFVALGTRFKLLFLCVPFFVLSGIISIININKRSVLALLFVVLMFMVISSWVLKNRNQGFNSTSIYADEIEVYDADLFVRIANEMSPEGVLYMSKVANDYFSVHPLSYGREIATIFYFWIPRKWWPDKPTMLDHWLIRKYEDVHDAHSTASGFMGELRADFGTFSLLFTFLIGYLLKLGDTYISRVFSNKEPSYNMIFALALFPFVFFAVRSPVTSYTQIFWEIVVYMIVRKIFCDKITDNYTK